MDARRAFLNVVVIASLNVSIFATAQAIVAPTTAILDNRGTMVIVPSLRMRWHQLVPGRGFDNAVLGATQVNVHLATSPWIGRRARVYMALDRGAGPEVRADWTAGGTLLSGSVISGGRTLVFAGVVRSAAISETLQVTLTTDGRQLTAPVALNFQFQIEAEQ